MKFPKLGRLHITIIGVVVCLIVAAGMYFLLISKAKDRLKAETSRYNQYASTGTIMNVQKAQADYQKALQEVAEAQNKLDKYMRAKMPNLNLARRDTGMLALWHEQSEVLGPLLIRWIKKSPVTLESSIAIPAPPANPNDPALATVPIVIPVGTVRVSGSFKNIMEHLREWNSCSRLVMIDSPALTGESPNLVCEYGLTVYIFPRTEAGPPIAIAGTPGQEAGGFGGMPGMPGMGPGMMPPMPMPGAGPGMAPPPPGAGG